jgi:hypothetical protein
LGIVIFLPMQPEPLAGFFDDKRLRQVILACEMQLLAEKW